MAVCYDRVSLRVTDLERSVLFYEDFCLDEASYDEVLARLIALGLVKREPTVNKGTFGDGLATYFTDPDGNELEIKKYSV